MALGWKTWDVCAKNEEHDQIKIEGKEKRKEEGKAKAKKTREENKKKKKEAEAAAEDEAIRLAFEKQRAKERRSKKNK